MARQPVVYLHLTSLSESRNSPDRMQAKITKRGSEVSLRETFFQLGTLCDKFEHYLPLYEKWFGKFVNRAPRILEVGVQFGGSAEMWYKYFGAETEIVGIDIAPRSAGTSFLKVIQGDQGSTAFWDDIARTYGEGYFDIIIDDGSHDNVHQIVTLQKTYGLLRDGGVYWCEDVHTSYYKNVRVQGGGLRNPESFIEFSKQIIDVINEKHTKFAIGVGKTPAGPHVDPQLLSLFRKVQGVHFYDSIVVLEKGEPLKFNRINSAPNMAYNRIDNPQAEEFTLD
ncbi:hypothetical protein PDO_1699 [Rhizobium sp. PDO1-076]|nr:hypothetical protein PDO_1699 [Rhizobium sp. PDO1-076]